MFENQLLDLFSKIGMTKWPLLACSVIGVAIIVERGLYFIRLRFDDKTFSRELFSHLRQNQLMQAIHYCQNQDFHPIPHIAGTYLRNLTNKQRDSILTREGSLIMEKVETRLRGLATITHIAPVLGLLGTVLGLVNAFHEIETTVGPIQAQNLAGGIWEALLSTVLGLIVAIPCMVFYHTYESRADRIARRVQTMVTELDEYYGNVTES